MQVTCEFRVLEEFAHLLFSPCEGKKVSSLVRKIVLDVEDPRYNEVGRLQREIRAATGGYFFYGWRYNRTYTRAEIQNAELFLLKFAAQITFAGEQCGTLYDRSTECQFCGVGFKQVSELHLDSNKIPKNKDIVRTLADEWLVSQRFANFVAKNAVSGLELKPVKQISSRKVSSSPWYQLFIASPPVSLHSDTKAGIAPFDDDAEGKYRCPLGHVLGLGLLSEVYVERFTLPHADVCCTRECFGVRRGVLQPAPLLLIGSHLQRLLVADGFKGFNLEIAYLR